MTGTTWARTTRASPQIRSHRIGLRLCGIALEPFWPDPNGSDSSRTSVRWPCRTSSAIASQTVAMHRERRHPLADAVADDDLGRDVRRRAARATSRRAARRPGRCWSRCRPRRRSSRCRPRSRARHQPVPRTRHREREVGDPVTPDVRLGVHAVGPPDPQRGAVRRARGRAASRPAPSPCATSRSVASTSCNASAVSSRSLDVMP